MSFTTVGPAAPGAAVVVDPEPAVVVVTVVAVLAVVVVEVSGPAPSDELPQPAMRRAATATRVTTPETSGRRPGRRAGEGTVCRTRAASQAGGAPLAMDGPTLCDVDQRFGQNLSSKTSGELMPSPPFVQHGSVTPLLVRGFGHV
jgi:hypothetical protein